MASSSLKPIKLYSLKQVKENNGNSTEGHNVWIVVNNSVYNVTEFLNEVRYLSFQIKLPTKEP